MQRPEVAEPSVRGPAEDIQVDPVSEAISRSLQPAFDSLWERVVALENEIHQRQRTISFVSSRSSWTVNQLADDLQVHPNTVLNWLALPAEHPRHLESFQPGGAGPHKILPEHIADWMSRNKSHRITS